MSPPLPLMLPAKMLDPPKDTVSRPLPSCTPPAPVSAPTTSLPPSASVAPASTFTSGRASSRRAEPSVRVPPTTLTLVTPAVPSKLLLPLDSNAPAPRLACTAPPLSV